ncbi:TDT family transporter [Streptomyces sp. NPDC015414]|uniref:SLAC1 family transporter n=1 Tax=Streptomyces sp. NPDC015414 TaxID=3364957 RepID=UPI0036F55367
MSGRAIRVNGGIMPARRIPFNAFGIPFGLAGLAGVWLTAARQGYTSIVVGNVLAVAASVTWCLVVFYFLRYAAISPGAARQDFVDPVLSPFASLFSIVPMLLSAVALAPYAHTLAVVLVDVFLVITFVIGAWFTGQWIYGPLNIANLHPGYFLPTVAGGFVAAASAGVVGQYQVARVMFGLGFICWLILGSMILGRLFFGPPLPPPLVPTLAIEVAPAAVATMAYVAAFGPQVTGVVVGLAGYGLLMVASQLRLIPMFMKLPFFPGFWAFTFSWAVVVSATLYWIEQQRVPGAAVYVYVLLTLLTLSYVALGIRTGMALARGQLFPPPGPAHAAPSDKERPETGSDGGERLR